MSSTNVTSNPSHPLAFVNETALTASVAKPTDAKTQSIAKTTLSFECDTKTARAMLSKPELLKRTAVLPYIEGVALMNEYPEYTYTDEEIWKEIGGIPREKFLKKIEDLRKLFPKHYLSYAACNTFGCVVSGHEKGVSGKSGNLFLLSSEDANWQKFDRVCSERDSGWIRTVATPKNEIVMEIYLRTLNYDHTINGRFAQSVSTTLECDTKTARAMLSQPELLKRAVVLPYKEGVALMNEYPDYTFTDEEVRKEIGGIPREKILKKIEDLRKLFPEHDLNYAACNPFGCVVIGYNKGASGESGNLFLLSSEDANWQKFDAVFGRGDCHWIRTFATPKKEIVMEIYLPVYFDRTIYYDRTINGRFAAPVSTKIEVDLASLVKK